MTENVDGSSFKVQKETKAQKEAQLIFSLAEKGILSRSKEQKCGQ